MVDWIHKYVDAKKTCVVSAETITSDDNKKETIVMSLRKGVIFPLDDVKGNQGTSDSQMMLAVSLFSLLTLILAVQR